MQASRDMKRELAVEKPQISRRTWMKAVFGHDFLLLLLAGINPLLSTALADGGAAAIVPVLQTTFTNPTPAAVDWFGWSVAAVGSDRVLIGAPGAVTGPMSAGEAYLFSANGILLTIFTNPTPANSDNFGWSVAAVGSERVLIGAPGDDTGTTNAGAAYLFSTNGTLLNTFTNPAPAAYDKFGNPVVAVGSDRVLIIANGGTINAGAAYLFSTNGTLLTTFTNPTSTASDVFGSSAAAVGNDRVLIGAFLDDAGATDAGAAYLFSVNGTPVTTFTKPSPATGDRFGSAVAAVGSDRVLIGAIWDDTGAPNAGAAYIFSTNGMLLTTFIAPYPATSGLFGSSVAGVGSDRALIGAPYDNTGAAQAGAVYLFALIPSLNIEPTSTSTLAVSWPLFAPDFLLQQNTNGLATANWSNVTDTVQDDGTNKYLIIDPAVGNRFYRLSKQSQ